MAAEKLIKTDQNEFISQMYCYVVKANTRPRPVISPASKSS